MKTILLISCAVLLIAGLIVGVVTYRGVTETSQFLELERPKDPLPRLMFLGDIDNVRCVAVSPDGMTVAAGAGNTIRFWDAASGKEQATLTKAADYGVDSVAFSPDGKILATGNEAGTIKLWEVTTGKERSTFKGHAGSVLSLAYSADSGMLASGGADKTIKLWDVKKTE